MGLSDPLLIMVGVLLVAVALLVAVLLYRSGRGVADAERRAVQMAEISERLAHSQGELAGRLEQAQRGLDERLDALSKRLGDSLAAQTEKTGETLRALHERLAVIDVAQKNITELSTQMVSFQELLSNKQARGAFGEVQLHDLVANALPPSAYSFQTPVGEYRADCLIRLPNPPGPIVIDAKFPLESFNAMRTAEGRAAKVQAERAFTQDVLRHVKDIQEKYIVPGETAESALMFLPSEAVYAELHARFRNVIEESYRRRVWIVSPTTLWATLNTIRAVLKDVSMREQAGVIQREVLAMAGDVGRLDDRVGKLQRHFDNAVDDVRQIRISTDKITRRAERIEEVQLSGEEAETELVPPHPRIGTASGK